MNGCLKIQDIISLSDLLMVFCFLMKVGTINEANQYVQPLFILAGMGIKW